MTTDRRQFLQSVAGSAAALVLPGPVAQAADAIQPGDWEQADRIRQMTRMPRFPAREFNVTEFGASTREGHDSSDAFRQAIERCSASGGGRVRVPPGVYRTGPIYLKSNVNLHLEAGATLSFSTDPQRYLPPVLTHWEGLELMGYSPLVYANGEHNIAITGKGVLEGNAGPDAWWPWKGGRFTRPGHGDQAVARNGLMEDAENGVPVEERVYADGAYLRPPFIQPIHCSQVLIEGITIRNSPFWLINPVLSEHVTVRDVTCESLGPNSDGCDPESCNYVVIEDCLFDTGDDCIAIKSGRNADGRRLDTPCQNIVIANCEMRAGHGGVVIGSEISGGVRNVFAENCRMSSPDLDRAIRIKTNSVRGGVIEHLRYRNILVGEVRDAIVINFYYEEGDKGQFDPTVRDVEIRDLICLKAKTAFQVRGFERAPISDLRLVNLEFVEVKKPGVIENVKGLTATGVLLNGQPLRLPLKASR